MHGDFSRTTFDSTDGYRSVLLQQGRVLLDADVNEQADITAHHDEVRAADVIGRSGGPAPASGPGPFAITAGDGSQPAATPWSQLQVTSGHYYADGVVCEAEEGFALADQPHLVAPGLAEPSADRVGLYLDVWTRMVTAEEDPALLEVALGGPDTTVRAQTVWQVRAEPVTGTCVDVHRPDWLARTPRSMVAALLPPGSTPDPCRITESGGYQRLENQLYRVEVHDPATFVWSRDNGSVFAGLDALDDLTAAGAVLGLDREGRDEASSIAAGDLVEITSEDVQLRGERGFLARAGTPVVASDPAGTSAVSLPVSWVDAGNRPASLAALGRAPIVRRWDGGPLAIKTTATELEGGITVRFPAGGTAAVGDYWLIPARAVRMAYGLTQASGTIEWPPGGRGPVEQPPAGPRHHVAPLAILARDGGGWTLEHDCRNLFPPLTAMISIDLVGGDGQEAMPGDPLPAEVRVVVRNGGLPVAVDPVRFTTSGGHVSPAIPGAGDPAALTVDTGDDGVAAVRWLLNPGGDTTQTMTIHRLDSAVDPTGADIVVTGRLSVASQVQWQPPDCRGLGGTRTVQEALTTLSTAQELRLLGGDGQQVAQNGRCVPQPVRVVVDSPCGPVASVKVVASAGEGLVAPADPGQPTPDTLVGTGADAQITAVTDDLGVVSLWWQPGFANATSATLDIVTAGTDDAPVRVSASLDTGGGRTPGAHIVGLEFGSGRRVRNDARVHPDDLATGIVVSLDADLEAAAVSGKPVARVELDLPWPVKGDGDTWSGEPVGYRTVVLAADLKGAGPQFTWNPRPRTQAWFQDMLWGRLADAQWEEPLLCRFIVDGWAIPAGELHVNGHAVTRLRGGRTELLLPTDDEVTGGVFSTWFWLTREVDRVRRPVPDVIGRTLAVAQRVLEAEGFAVKVVQEVGPLRRGLVLATEPAPGVDLEEGATVTVTVSGGR